MTVDQIAVHIFAPTIVPAPAYAPPSEPSTVRGVESARAHVRADDLQARRSARRAGDGQPAPLLTPVSGQTYTTQGVDAQITFDVDPNGTVKGLTLHQNGKDQHANKSR